LSGVPAFIKNILLPRHSRLGRLLRRWREARSDRRFTPPYGPVELHAKADEFNRNAETYWKEVEAETSSRTEALRKPFTTISGTASLLFRVGLVLEELRPGIGHVVLDLGAGTCWLSAWLNRLNCRTISMDVSPTALKLGRELFRREPDPRPDLEPQFLVYDGRRLPLPDESVDRVVCFDAFHHIPNGAEILGEIFRVLKPGGRAVFAEPGEGHSRAGHSRLEAERFGVLENELDLKALAAEARRLGFTGFFVKPYPDPRALTLESGEYFEFMNGRDRFFPVDVLRRSLRDFQIFSLMKGPEIIDSRNPSRLHAEISIVSGSTLLQGTPGAVVRVKLNIRNVGDTLWLSERQPGGGYVSLGGHLRDEKGGTLDWDFFRAPLPGPVPVHGSVDVEADVRLPERSGRYRVRFDLVDENVAWFAQQGSTTIDVDMNVIPA
jgi:SAM-dependent methyltransferase